MKQFKLIIEKHTNGFVAYPLGLNGIIVGQGETFEAAFSDVKSAIRYHIENFGDAVFDVDSTVLEVFVAEATIED